MLTGSSGQRCEGRTRSEGQCGWGRGKPGRPESREKGPFRDQCVWGGSVPGPLPADVPSHHCPKKQGREGGSTTGETESGEFFAEAPLAPMHLTLLTMNQLTLPLTATQPVAQPKESPPRLTAPGALLVAWPSPARPQGNPAPDCCIDESFPGTLSPLYSTLVDPACIGTSFKRCETSRVLQRVVSLPCWSPWLIRGHDCRARFLPLGTADNLDRVSVLWGC